MTLYNVVGIDDLEDLTFARCTTIVKAERAKSMLEDEGLECMVRIVKDEVDVDTVEINGRIVEL